MNKTYYFLSVMFTLISVGCTQSEAIKASNFEAENENSKLIPMLLGIEDFKSSEWTLGYSTIFQGYNENENILEKASFNLIAKHDAVDFYNIIHTVFLCKNTCSGPLEGFYIFEQDPLEIKSLPIESSSVGEVKCAILENTGYQECIFLKNYERIVSSVAVIVKDSIDRESIAELTLPLLNKVDARIQELLPIQ